LYLGHPLVFVRVASKRLRLPANLLESTLIRLLVSVDPERFKLA
jgi:hypothetical protein